jgi:hypothetical protein
VYTAQPTNAQNMGEFTYQRRKYFTTGADTRLLRQARSQFISSTSILRPSLRALLTSPWSRHILFTLAWHKLQTVYKKLAEKAVNNETLV